MPREAERVRSGGLWDSRLRETPIRVKKWLGPLLVLAVLILLAFGAYLLVLRGMAHKYYEVEGTIRVTPPAPSDMPLPAVACLWAGRDGRVYPRAVTGSGDVDGNAYIVCEIPADAVAIPFKTSTYGNAGYGIQIGAYLRSVPWSHPSCADRATPVVLAADQGLTLQRICQYGEHAPKSETALAAPFDGGENRATETLRIVVTRAE